MTPNKSQYSRSGISGAIWRRVAFVSLAAMALLGEAGAAQKTYQYFRFEPKQMQNNSSQIQLGEFTFSLNGTVLNLNNRNASGTNVVAVTAASGAQAPDGAEGPNKIFDGKPITSGNATTTKWFNGAALTQPLDITFTAGPVTVDSYNFATANDSASYSRTPVSWFLYGRNNTADPWELIDSRSGQTMTYANNTYQAGYTLPEVLNPVISYFRVQNTVSAGTAGIVRDDDVNGVKLEWDTSLGDTNGTTVTPAPGAVAQVSSATIDPPNNATTTYTVTATRALPAPAASASQTVQVRSVVGGTASFQYVRFKATKLKSGLATGTIQVSEFGFTNSGTPVPVTGATQTGANTPAGEDITKLWNGITTDKWLDFNNAAVVFDLGTAANTFSHYFFVTGNDAPERDPIRWTLEGSNDQTTWTLIENVNFDYPSPAGRNINSRSIPLPGASMAPSVLTFFGDGTTIYEGTPLKLSWTTAGAATVSIDQGIGPVAASDTITVTPPLGATTYTLTASSAGGVANTLGTFTVNVIAGPPPSSINYPDFSAVTNEFTLQGSSSFVNGNLLLTPDTGGQRGEAWFRAKQHVAGGFEATFGLSMTHTPNGFTPADGVAFVIQNHPQGSGAASTGEGGVTANALNITFKTFGFNAADASRIQVLNGSTVLQTASASNVPGITYKGLTGLGYPTLVGMPGTDPYRIRVVYVPGDEFTDSLLDVYLNDVAVIENLVVDLEDIDAVDANGNAFVGFSARTGGNFQQNQITNWKMGLGDFSALPPFGLVKGFKNTLIAATPTWDLVWSASENMSYAVQSTSDFVTWDDETSFGGEAGQIGVKIAIDPLEPKRFYRVVEEDE